MICLLARAPSPSRFAGPSLSRKGRGAMIAYSPLPSLELRLDLLQERFVADLKVLGVVAQESLVDLGRVERRALLQPAHEFLMPAGDQRRPGGDAARRCVGFLLDFVV